MGVLLVLEQMSRGWAKGSKDFKKAVLADLKDEAVLKVVESEAAEMREPRWERAVRSLLDDLGKSEGDLVSSRKGAPWKVAVARVLRERCLAPNQWIAQRLHMGAVSTVQSLVSRHRTNGGESDTHWRQVKNHETLDL